MKSLSVRPSILWVQIFSSDLPHDRSRSGWCPSVSAISPAPLTKSSAVRKSGKVYAFSRWWPSTTFHPGTCAFSFSISSPRSAGTPSRQGMAAADAHAAEDNLVLAHLASAQRRAPRRVRQVEPRDVLHRVTAFADEVMMAAQIGVKAGRLSLRHHLAHQPRLGQRPQVVIDRGPRSPWIVAVHSAENLLRRGVDAVLNQVLQHGIALGGGPQGSRLERLFELGT